jgi:hypothetical protein
VTSKERLMVVTIPPQLVLLFLLRITAPLAVSNKLQIIVQVLASHKVRAL